MCLPGKCAATRPAYHPGLKFFKVFLPTPFAFPNPLPRHPGAHRAALTNGSVCRERSVRFRTCGRAFVFGGSRPQRLRQLVLKGHVAAPAFQDTDAESVVAEADLCLCGWCACKKKCRENESGDVCFFHLAENFDGEKKWFPIPDRAVIDFPVLQTWKVCVAPAVRCICRESVGLPGAGIGQRGKF